MSILKHITNQLLASNHSYTRLYLSVARNFCENCEHDKTSVDVFQVQEHGEMEFNSSQTRDIGSKVIDCSQSMNNNIDGEQSYDTEHKKISGEEKHTAAYNVQANVNLYSSMQSTVPEPTQPYNNLDANNNVGEPSHFNMPGSGLNQREKFLYEKIQRTHPNKNYSTSTQGFQGEANDGTNKKDSSTPSLYSAQQGLQDGTKSLQEIFSDRSNLIKDSLEKFGAFNYDAIEPSLQESREDHHFSQSIPCPQGIQGYECEQFKLWFNNCVKYGLNCNEQLEGVSNGRLTLQQVFKEQNDLIDRVAKQYSVSKRRCYSTSALKEESAVLSKAQKLKTAIRDYGSTIIVFHIGIALTSLGGFYTLISCGVPVEAFLKAVGIGQTHLDSGIVAGASKFVVAYAVHKIFAPVRIGITLTCAPLIVQFLRAKNILKTPN